MDLINNKCYIVPSTKCNADCFFCVNKSYDYQEKIFMDPKSDQFYTTLHFIDGLGIKKFEITGGGEPFLNKDLQDIIDNIQTYISDARIKLYTNGIIKREISHIQELDISTAHWDNNVLVDVYKNSDKANLLEQLKFFYNPDKYRIRLSVPIYKGGIDCTDKAEELINRTKPYVDSYVFRPLLERTPNRDDFYVDFNIVGDNIEVDRECSCYSRICLWWTDNHIYTDWNRKNILR